MADPQQIVQSQTTIPDYAKPYVENLLGQTAGTLYNYATDASGNVIKDSTGMPVITGLRGYEQYGSYDENGQFIPGERTAQFTDLQKQAYGSAANLGQDPYSQTAAMGLLNTANRAANYGYTPTGYTNQYQAPAAYRAGNFSANQVTAPQLRQYQMRGPQNVSGATANAAQMSQAPSVKAAQLAGVSPTSYQNVAADRVSAPQLRDMSMQAATMDRAGLPALQQYQMGPAQQISTQSFAQPGSAQAYMSPYMQNVVDVQQREAERASNIQRQQNQAQAVKAGAFGGSRQAIVEAERQRNLALQKGDIQATGSQAAYQQAQQQFNAEQQARLQAAQGNQQAGLTVGQQNLMAQLQTQGLSANQALAIAQANQQAQQQANLQNLSAGLQTQGLQAQTGLQAQQANQQTGLQAALANQQAGINTGQFNAQQAYNTQLQNAQLAQQAALANQGLSGQYGLQQGQFSQAANLQNAQLAQQAALANQSMGYNVNNANLQALLAQQQLGSGQNLQAQLANQQYGLQAQQLAEQARQFGYGQQMTAAGNMAQYGQAANQLNEQANQYAAGLGLQGMQSALGAYGNLGTLGNTLYNQNVGNINLQQQLGTQQQQQVQNILNTQYQDYLNQQNYPYKQLGYMSDMLRGLPLTQQSSSIYQAPPSTMSQVAGLGLAGASMYNMMKKKGGRIKGAGLADLAVQKITQE